MKAVKIIGALVTALIFAPINSLAGELKELGVYGEVVSTEPYKAQLKSKGKKKPTPKRDKVTTATIEKLMDPRAFIEKAIPVVSSSAKPSTAPLNKTTKIKGAASLCIIGADEISKSWIKAHAKKVRDDVSICYIANVATIEEYNEIKELIKLPIFPLDLDAKNLVINISQYPAVIANGRMYNYEK